MMKDTAIQNSATSVVVFKCGVSRFISRLPEHIREIFANNLTSINGNWKMGV